MKISFDPALSLKESVAFPGATPVQLVTIHYRNALRKFRGPASGRDFAYLLNQATKEWKIGITHQTLHNWENGVTHPNVRFLQILRMQANQGSWQAQFANDLLAAIFPGEYQPSGLIGKTLLQGRRRV